MEETTPPSNTPAKSRNQRPKPPKAEVQAEAQAVSRYQAFVSQRVSRKDIHGATYNPRVISPEARAKLMLSLKKNGLVEPIIVNKRTMTVVGGHQRLSILDDLEDDPNYLIDVSLIDVSEAKEKEINVALNSQAMAGQYDNELLLEVLKDITDVAATGMDAVELELMGVEQEAIHTLFALENQTQETKDAIKEVEDIGQLKGSRKKHQADDRKEHDETFYATVVFKNGEQRAAFLAAFGLSAYSRYIEGPLIAERLGIKLPEAIEPPNPE